MGIYLPKAWKEAASFIRECRASKVLVLGATDRGKSTFCQFLIYYLLQEGLSLAFIDADVGQKDLGPPATITLGYPRLNLALSELTPSAWYFVGAVSPVAHLLPMVVGTRQLLDQAEAQTTIINTSGLVKGVGEVLKTYKIDALRPDIIVALEQDGELDSLLTAHRHLRLLRLSPSSHAQVKSPKLRFARRQAAFRQYFRAARNQALPLADLAVQRLPINVDPTDLDLCLTPNLLCGLADSEQRLLGLGLIRRFDAAHRQLWMFTPVEGSRVKVVQLGELRLDLKG